SRDYLPVWRDAMEQEQQRSGAPPRPDDTTISEWSHLLFGGIACNICIATPNQSCMELYFPRIQGMERLADTGPWLPSDIKAFEARMNAVQSGQSESFIGLDDWMHDQEKKCKAIMEGRHLLMHNLLFCRKIWTHNIRPILEPSIEEARNQRLAPERTLLKKIRIRLIQARYTTLLESLPRMLVPNKFPRRPASQRTAEMFSGSRPHADKHV
ncbi:hypothetical protein OF83DRAFT_1089754, partial [Amylostereum chailletii]